MKSFLALSLSILFYFPLSAQISTNNINQKSLSKAAQQGVTSTKVNQAVNEVKNTTGVQVNPPPANATSLKATSDLKDRMNNPVTRRKVKKGGPKISGVAKPSR